MAGSRVMSGSPGWKLATRFTASAPRAATARPYLSSEPMLPSSPWWREITTSGVQRFGRMPSRSNSIGRSSGLVSVSAM